MVYLSIFFQFFKLGCTSFGGPIAHIGFFRREFVEKENLLTDSQYSSLVALCQFLPGPASSQVGMAIGFLQGGILGSLLAWLGFTLPSAIIMIVLGWGITHWNLTNTEWFHGLKLAAVSIVLQAILSMAKNLTPDRIRMSIAFVAFALVLFIPSTYSQILAIVLSGILGFFLVSKLPKENLDSFSIIDKFNRQVSKKFSLGSLILFFLILGFFPILHFFTGNPYLSLMDSFYRVGALVFGGGHVVLPLLEKEMVTSGLVTKEEFLAGYGFANALPGPLFSFSAYLGFVQKSSPNGILGATLSLIFVFLPSFFLVWGIFPFWNSIQKKTQFQWIGMGLNAGVVGILLAAFYNPVFVSTVGKPSDFVIVVFGFVLLEYWNAPSYSIVFLCALLAFLLNFIS